MKVLANHTTDRRDANSPEERPAHFGRHQRGRLLAVWVIAALAGYGKWLIEWGRFALADDLASYVLLIPVISGYLIWQRRSQSFHAGALSSSLPAGIAALAGSLILTVLAAISQGAAREGGRMDYLSVLMPGFFLFILAGCLLAVGRSVIRPHWFAISFLIFAAPLPSWAVQGIETFYQYTSAEVAAVMINLSGLPNLRSGLVFKLPGITIQVAQECSGIRSSVVLFITSILAGHLFLKTAWRRWVLALVIIPLGIVRNGLRILTIAALCVHVGPEMIDSPIHHRGGPIFFGLSLIPLFALLLWLRRIERSQESAPAEKTVIAPATTKFS